MKILVLCSSPGLGGLELYAEREWHYLQQAGHECHFAIVGDGRLAKRNRDSAEYVFYMDGSSKFLPIIQSVRLAHYITQNGIDVVHMHWGKDLNLAALAKRFSQHNVKLIYTRHMGITRSKKDPIHRFFYRPLDVVLTISKQVEKEARMYLPLAKQQIKLLYLGVDDRTVIPTDCRQLPENISQSGFKISLFGRIEHGKGQHVLVDAMSILVKDSLDVSVTFVGQVMDEDYFRKLKQSIRKQALDERVSFMKFVDNTMAVMPCFNVVVLATYCETFGLVLVEAMRAGVAVIATNAGGVPEIIEHEKTGLLTPPGDSKALARALSRLYNDTNLRKQLASAGKNKADSEFNAELHFNKLEKELDSCITAVEE